MAQTKSIKYEIAIIYIFLVLAQKKFGQMNFKNKGQNDSVESTQVPC